MGLEVVTGVVLFSLHTDATLVAGEPETNYTYSAGPKSKRVRYSDHQILFGSEMVRFSSHASKTEQ